MESVIRLPASTGEALGEAVVDLATFLKGESPLLCHQIVLGSGVCSRL